LTLGSVIRNRFFSGSRISDPGSQTHIFESLVTIFWLKSSVILGKFAQIFSSAFQKRNSFQFCEICGYRKRYDKKFFFTACPFFCCCFWIRDPGSGMGKSQDPGSGINIPDPQHCVRILIHTILQVSPRGGSGNSGNSRRRHSSFVILLSISHTGTSAPVFRRGRPQ
jgi:hypothetical protein